MSEPDPFAVVLVPTDPDRPLYGPVRISRMNFTEGQYREAADLVGLKEGQYTVRDLVDPEEFINPGSRPIE